VDPAAAHLTVEYWADYICPWCYLALDRVAHLTAAHGADVIWRPYELHPEIPTEGAPLPHFSRAEDTDRYLTAELRAAGLDIARRDRWSNSARALALSTWAQDRPEWPALHHALYEAYWLGGRDIGDPRVLTDVATRSGIPSDLAMEALASGRGREEAVAAKERAIDLGIAATPGWHFGDGIVLSGAHPRETFDKVLARRRP
jgi:predicted DsbA family dithiol-disulfide isomerase